MFRCLVTRVAPLAAVGMVWYMTSKSSEQYAQEVNERIKQRKENRTEEEKAYDAYWAARPHPPRIMFGWDDHLLQRPRPDEKEKEKDDYWYRITSQQKKSQINQDQDDKNNE